MIVGYRITSSIDRGDEWLNAVDPKSVTSTLHKECAWDLDMLNIHNSDVEELERINSDAARGLICDFCNQPLTSKQYFSFQKEYKERNETGKE